MTSILSNAAATVALQTLRSIAADAREVQNQVSTGLRVGTAADNAAYWSISTTMSSDTGSMSAALDTLGLGAAMVDTAYSGLDTTAGLLTEIKSRVVAAKEAGADRRALQGEIDELKQQVVSVAESSSFSGRNWLSTSIPDIYTQGITSTAGSTYGRDEDGIARVRRIEVPMLGTALFNTTGGGLLQADDRSIGDIGGLRGTTLSGTGTARSAGYTFDGPLVFADDTMAVTFDITLDGDDPATTPNPQPGQTISVTIDRSLVDSLYPANSGVVSYIGEWSDILEAAIGRTEIYVPYNTANLGYSLHTRENLGRGSSVFISNVSSTLAGGGTGGIADMASPVYGTRPQRRLDEFSSGFTLAPSNRIDIPVTVNGTDYSVRITRDVVDAALGSQSGVVADRDDFIAVLNLAMIQAGAGLVATSTGSAGITFTVDPDVHPEAGRKASFEIGPATDLVGEDVVSADLMSLDISGADANIDASLNDVEVMLGRVVSAAARMGAVSSRMETLQEITRTLIDSIKTGIGRLVDADMDEASSRLAAVQARESLAIKSLSIANDTPQLIASLFE